DVVHANDFPAEDVDDLLIEKVALEEQNAVRGRVPLPRRAFADSLDSGAAGLDRAGRYDAVALSSADDQIRDAGGMILGSDGDFAHTSTHRAGGIADARAEQFREGDDGHGRRSPDICSCLSITDGR